MGVSGCFFFGGGGAKRLCGRQGDELVEVV
jgi:hypothetical protein